MDGAVVGIELSSFKGADPVNSLVCARYWMYATFDK